MAVWYVARGPSPGEGEKGPIVSAHGTPQPGYAEEALDDATDAELQAYRGAPAPVPRKVGAGSFFRALYELDALESGWLAPIEASIAQLGQQNPLVPVLWQRASQFERYHELLVLVGTMAGKDDEDLDRLFRRAWLYDVD